MGFIDGLGNIEQIAAQLIEAAQTVETTAAAQDWDKAYAAADAGSLGVTPNPTLEDTQWKSSHNSFQRNETIFEQWQDWDVHSFELDIHAGDPPAQWPFPDNRPEQDWYVYHNTFDQDTHYTYLSDGLEEVARINEADPDHAPITLFIDLKGDVFQSGQTIDDLDILLERELGDSLYTPQDFVARGDAATLPEALQQNGWPTVGNELNGKVIVVLTGGLADGQLGEYTGNPTEATERAAFIAPNAEFSYETEELGRGGTRQVEPATFESAPNAIFYNMNADDIDNAHLVTDQDFSLRVWDLNKESAFVEAQEADANYLGTNKVNTDRDTWSTSNSGGAPFTTLE